MEESGIMDEVNKIIKFTATLINSLIHGQDNNLYKQFQITVNKHITGKRVDHS